MNDSATKCDVCQRERETMVVCSGLGPMSLAYCGECGCKYAEPEWMFAFTLDQTGGNIADWVRQLCTFKDGAYLAWDEWLAASVDERSQSQDAEERLGPKDASAVRDSGDAQTQSSTGAGQ